MANQDKTPQIRFAGFTGDWEQRKLGEIGKTFSGLSGKTKEDFGSGDARYITYMNVFLNPLANKNGTEKTGIDKKQNQVMRGDVLFTTSSETPEEVGMSSVWLHDEPNIYLNSFCFGFRADLVFDYNYFAFFLRSQEFRRKMELLAQGISRYNISKNRVMDIRISLPSLLEQTRIGNFFRNLDSLITQHQQELEKLKIMKKAMLEKMFPKAGAAAPEIRFAGFTGDWERRKLGELSDVYDGTHQTPKYSDSGVMFLSVENIKNLQSEKYISKNDFEKEFKVFPEKDDVLMTRIGDVGTANVVESNEPKAYYVSLALLKHKKLNSYFLKESISSETVKKELWHRTLHIAFPKKINKNEIENVCISYPIDSLEQTRIGNFFRNLDTLITQHQRKLDKLVLIKKAMLGKMFV